MSLNQIKDANRTAIDDEHRDQLFINMKLIHSIALVAWGMSSLLATEVYAEVPISEVQGKKLIRVVRQDCGSCHGMRLTGGLGPALTPESIQHMPAETLSAIIYHGIPGTPMPGWKTMLTEAEVQWISKHLLAGFPEELPK